MPLSDGTAAASHDGEAETESAGGVATEVAVADAPFEKIEDALVDVELTVDVAEPTEASPGDGAEGARDGA